MFNIHASYGKQGERWFTLKESLTVHRSYNAEKNRKLEVISTVCIVLFGAISGIAAKAADNLAVNDDILWQRFIGSIDLSNILSRLAVWALIALCLSVYSKRPFRAAVNVFGFFTGMLTGYYTVTVTVSGFFPKAYMIAWGVISLFTPLLAYLAWYAKGNHWTAIALSSVIISLFASEAFSFGMWYLDIAYYPECIFLLIAVAVLFQSPKQIALALVGALVAAPILQLILPFIFGGL